MHFADPPPLSMPPAGRDRASSLPANRRRPGRDRSFGLSFILSALFHGVLLVVIILLGRWYFSDAAPFTPIARESVIREAAAPTSVSTPKFNFLRGSDFSFGQTYYVPRQMDILQKAAVETQSQWNITMPAIWSGRYFKDDESEKTLIGLQNEDVLTAPKFAEKPRANVDAFPTVE